MLLLLSPAKSLNFDKPAKDVLHTQPLFVKQAAELMDILKPKSPQEIASLMHVSDILAWRTVAYSAAWQPQSTCDNVKQAVLAFNGNVYRGLDAHSLGTDELDWIQNHVCILSGLYGVLRPLDRIQPYRLEMGTPLPNSQGENLYEFWGTQISEYVNQRLKKDPDPVLVNLASVEYFKAVDTQKARVVNCVFEDFKDGRYKIISIHAKRARGLMARFAAMHHVTHPEQLQNFDAEGYAFDHAASGPDRLVFRRRKSG